MEQIAPDSSEVRTRIRLQQTPTKYNINPWLSMILKYIYHMCIHVCVYVPKGVCTEMGMYAGVDGGTEEAIRSLVEPAFVSSLT